MYSGKKFNLDRFKKTAQGILDFAQMFEQSSPAQQKRIQSQVSEQDPEFMYQVMKKVIYFDELAYLDEGALTELLSVVTPKLLAYSLYGKPPEFREKFLKNLGLKEKRTVQDEEEKFGSAPVLPSYTLGAQRQIIKIARGLEAKGTFALEITEAPRFKKKGAK